MEIPRAQPHRGERAFPIIVRHLPCRLPETEEYAHEPTRRRFSETLD
jgi:hypothetical protein